MTTFGELLSNIRGQRFVGRVAELDAFRRWLGADHAAPVLAVVGPGGIGKSWFLEACAADAESTGWRAIRIEGHTLAEQSTGRTTVLGDGGFPEGEQVLVVLDAVETLGPMTALLQQDLAALHLGTKVILSSRTPLRSGSWHRWSPLVRHLELGPLQPEEQRRYLDLRGVDDPAQRTRVLGRAGGHPLTLSLAVDLLVQAPEGRFEESGLWRSTVRMTVEELIADVGPQAREAIEAAAVLWRFDRQALAAVMEGGAADAAFIRLCLLSAARLDGGQLALHDDVRKAVVEDLRLHHPERLDLLRRRALRYYRRAAAASGGAEALRLSVERMHVVGRDMFALERLYGDDTGVSIARAATRDLPEILELHGSVSLPQGILACERDPVCLRRILEHHETVTTLARGEDGRLLAFAFYVPISERTRLLLFDDASDPVLAALDDRVGIDGSLPESTNVYFLSTIVAGDEGDAASFAALTRDVTQLLLGEGAYLFVPAGEPYVGIVRALGAEPIGGEGATAGHVPAYLLDLSRTGFEGWLRRLMAGLPPEQLPLDEELTGIVRAVADHLGDDARLAASPLAVLGEPDEEAPVTERAQAVRDLLDRARRAVGPWPTPELRVRRALEAAGPDARAALGRSTAVPGRPAGTGTQPSLVVAPSPLSPEVRSDRTHDGEGGILVRLLGRFSVVHDGADVAVPQGAVATTVKYVALRGVAPVDELIELLWPEVDPAVGRDRLKTVMARVRRAVGPTVVLRRGEELVLGPSVRVDAVEFDEAVRSALHLAPGPDRRTGAALAAVAYGGELLPGDRYEDWAAAPRERFVRRYLDVLDVLVEEAIAAAELDEAVRMLERTIEVTPFEEGRYIRAAELLIEAGRRGRAMAVLERAEAASAALGLAPSMRVAELRDQLRLTA